jgi:hypothetical protein
MYVTFHKGYGYLSHNADWLGYHPDYIRNPTGENRPNNFGQNNVQITKPKVRRNKKMELEERLNTPLKCEAKYFDFCPKDTQICGHWDPEYVFCGYDYYTSCAGGCGVKQNLSVKCPHCNGEIRIVIDDHEITLLKPVKYIVFQPLTGLTISSYDADHKAEAEELVHRGKGNFAIKEAAQGAQAGAKL